MFAVWVSCYCVLVPLDFEEMTKTEQWKVHFCMGSLGSSLSLVPIVKDKKQTQNNKLISVRETFDKFNLIPNLSIHFNCANEIYSFGYYNYVHQFHILGL